MGIRLTVVDRESNEHEMQASGSGSLMEVLRDLEFGVEAICGGMCSCATCHVYVAPEWLERLPQQHSDERELVSELQHRRESSRLACQIRLVPDLNGLRVTLAPHE
jgi:ferredoxin, 2Fe-2S